MPERPAGDSGAEFLKKKYDLHNAPEVEEQAKRAERDPDKEVKGTPPSRIQNYLDRFNEILERPSKVELGPKKALHTQTRERGIEALKLILYRKNVIKPQEIPEAYFAQQQKIARERGEGDIKITQKIRDQLTEVVIADQKSTLDLWVDYFASPDALYPDWLKYWATRSVLNMGEYDKEKKEFTKRSKGTVKPFPDLNREALAYVLDALEKKYSKRQPIPPGLGDEDKPAFEKLLQGENFPKLYAWAIEKVTPASKERLISTEGEWVKYDKGADHMPLVESLQGHGTGWCTAGESTAEAQLQNGDFYVYYSLDEHGKSTVPRAAIRMQGGKISEVRGIAKEQNLDPYIGEVVQQKMTEFPDGEAYEKKAGDMKQLTAIEKKMNAGQALTKNELLFLCEITTKIEGFGYVRDPRIKELRDQRNAKEDAPVVLGCAPEEIAWGQKEITQSTKAYIGPLFPGIFNTLEHLDHLYTSFPEGRIERRTIEIGGKTPQEYEAELARDGHQMSDWAKDILPKITPSKERREEDTFRLTVAALGFTSATRYDEICKRAKELGLELAPAELGPALRLATKDQAMNDRFIVGMEPLPDHDGDPSVFLVDRDEDGSWLYGRSGYLDDQCRPVDAFVFVRRKS